jgi:hypothetical protein
MSIPPPDPKLERQSDRLLSRNNAGSDPEYPAYSEEYLTHYRDLRRGGVVSIDTCEHLIQDMRAVDDLMDVLWYEVKRGANYVGVTERQMMFLERRRYNWSIQEIADDTGWSVGTVSRDLKNAAIRIQRIPAFAIWSVIAEVFRMRVETVQYILTHK